MNHQVSSGFLISIICIMRIEIMAQEMEPRLYASLPKNMNGAGIAYGISRGNVLTDPSLPISGLKITAHNIAGIYVRTFGLLNKLARVQVTIPYLYMSGTAEIDGRDTSVGRGGTGDPRIRFSMSLLGAPAYDRKEFSKYSQETVVGVSIVTSVPLGRYLDDKRVNTGSNRWGFKPEIGISKRFKNVYAEAFAGVWLYTNNTNYLAGKTLEQKPVYSFQGHITYNFKNRMGLSASGTWFNGGQTVINGTNSGELLDNWRAGVSWSVPAGRGHSVKLQFHTGAFTSTGYDYDMVLLAYQYVFF